MREIKFRAWNPSCNIWIKPHFIYLYNTKDNAFAIDHLESKTKDKAWSRDTNLILMQFTGLKDKNGKEIYEGDIISCTEGNHKDTLILGWCIDGYGYHWSKSKRMITDQDIIDKRYEVIGNIYENRIIKKRS